MRRALLLALVLFPWVAGSQGHNIPFAPSTGRVTQIFLGGVGVIQATELTSWYAYPAANGTGTASVTEGDWEAVMLSGTISEMRIETFSDVGTAGDDVTFTLRICDPTCADSAVTCTITAGAGTETNCEDTTNSFHVDAGDRISMEISTPAGSTPNANATPYWGWKWTGDNPGESMIVSNYTPHASTTGCGNMSGLVNNTTACASYFASQVPAAENFTITKLYARAKSDLGASDEHVASLYLNGSAVPGCSVTLNDATQEANDVCGESFATGSRVAVENDPGASNTYADNIAVTIGLYNAQGRFQTSSCRTSASSAAVANFVNSSGTTRGWTTGRTTEDAPSPGFSMTGFAARIDAAPAGAGESYTFRLEAAAADKVGCTITDTATQCEASGTGTIADADDVNLESVPANSPSAYTGICMSWSGTGTP